PQTDNEWFAYMQGDYRGRWYDIQFTVWQADLKPNVRDIPYFV
ncbi:6879_t:CDS:2, partial [Rhizophagus irregularis]